jgi:hypothetical protein
MTLREAGVFVSILLMVFGGEGQDALIPSARTPQLNVGAMTPPSTAQMGYSATYTGSGTITGVETQFVVPTVTLGTCDNCQQHNDVNFAAFLLNSGDDTTCSGFIQVGETYLSTGWDAVYMNGFNNCSSANMLTQITLHVNDVVYLELSQNSGITTFTIQDLTTGSKATSGAQSLSTWNRNLFQTMAESSSEGAGIGATTWDRSYFHDPQGNLVAVSTSYSPFQYGGVCSPSIYTLGSWSNTQPYGYNEAFYNTIGNCAFTLGKSGGTSQYGHCLSGGVVTNPTYLEGGPDGRYANLHASNLGDCAWVIANFGKSCQTMQFTGHLYIYGYSINNGAGAYYSNVTVKVSSTGTTWTRIYSQIWGPSSGPSGVLIGSVTNVQYVNITAVDCKGTHCGNYYGYSSNINVDDVEIG